jgi:hypothetical protein
MPEFFEANGRLDGGASRVWSKHEDNDPQKKITAFYFIVGHVKTPVESDPDFVLVLPDYIPGGCTKQDFRCGDSMYTLSVEGSSVRVNSYRYPERYASTHKYHPV